MTDDPRLAALAEALPVHGFANPCEGDTHRWCLTQAVAILDALDAAGWTLVRTHYLIAEAFTSKPSDVNEALARAALTKEDQRTSQHCSHCGHADIDHVSNDGSCVAPDCWCDALAGGSE